MARSGRLIFLATILDFLLFDVMEAPVHTHSLYIRTWFCSRIYYGLIEQGVTCACRVLVLSHNDLYRLMQRFRWWLVSINESPD